MVFELRVSVGTEPHPRLVAQLWVALGRAAGRLQSARLSLSSAASRAAASPAKWLRAKGWMKEGAGQPSIAFGARAAFVIVGL